MRIVMTVCTLVAWLALPVSMSIAAEPVRVVSEQSVSNPRQPQAAVDGEGMIYIAYGAGEAIYCSRSTDDGKSFGEPVEVANVPRLALGLRRGPRIVAGLNAIVITAISSNSGNLLSWRSIDGGLNWQGPTQVNDSPRDSQEGLHAMAMSPNGDVFCTWLDLRNKGTEIYGSLSTDGGETWNENRRVYRSPSGSICECCHPAVTYDSDSNLHVMWRNSLDGFRDLFVATSGDGGKTFSEGSKLGTGSWELDRCPMDGGWLAATGSGEMTTVWQRNKQVFRTDSPRSEEQLLGTGLQPWVARTSDGAYIVWLSRRNGDLWLVAPAQSKPLLLSSEATDPVIAAPVMGTGPVIAVWETGQKHTAAIMAVVVNR